MSILNFNNGPGSNVPWYAHKGVWAGAVGLVAIGVVAFSLATGGLGRDEVRVAPAPSTAKVTTPTASSAGSGGAIPRQTPPPSMGEVLAAREGASVPGGLKPGDLRVPEGAKLDLVAPSVEGVKLDVSALGNRRVAIWFWSPDCKGCRTNAAQFAALGGDVSDNVTVMAAALGTASRAAKMDFITNYGIEGLSSLDDPQGAFAKRFGVTEPNSWVFITPGGAVDSMGTGLDPDTVTSRIDRLAAG